MKLKVNKDLCIGCGACQAVCPEFFEIEDDGLAAVVVEKITDDSKEDALDAKEGCPTNAIEEVNEVQGNLAEKAVEEVNFEE